MTKGNLRVGFVGLGVQGGPMAEMIARDGWSLTVCDRRPETLLPCLELGAQSASTPFDLGRACDLVGVCVLDDDDVRDVVLGRGDGLLHAMAPGSIIAIHSTIHPHSCIELAEEAEAKGITLIDASVSGSGEAAYDKRLTVIAGGDMQAFERCRPIFESYGDPIRHLGPVGSGLYCKLINNVLFIANMKIARSALDAVAALEMDERAVIDILQASSGASYGIEALISITNSGNFDYAAMLLGKDLRLYQEIARGFGIPPSTVETVAQETVDMLQAMHKAQ